MLEMTITVKHFDFIFEEMNHESPATPGTWERFSQDVADAWTRHRIDVSIAALLEVAERPRNYKPDADLTCGGMLPPQKIIIHPAFRDDYPAEHCVATNRLPEKNMAIQYDDGALVFSEVTGRAVVTGRVMVFQWEAELTAVPGN